MDFTHPELDKLYNADIEASIVAPTRELYEFGNAVHGTANFFIDGRLVIANSTVQRGGLFCFGKGTGEEKGTVHLTKGKTYKFLIEYVSAPASKLVKPGVVAYGSGAGRLGMIEVIAPEVLTARAVKAASQVEVAIICAGTTRDHECEGYDRKDMNIFGAVTEMISAVLAAATNTIVVSQSGALIDMRPWADNAKAHLHAWFGRNEVGNGIADVLFGKVNPGGKLPLSLPKRIEDNPTFSILGVKEERSRTERGYMWGTSFMRR